jgi:hypothetical protein
VAAQAECQTRSLAARPTHTLADRGRCRACSEPESRSAVRATDPHRIGRVTITTSAEQGHDLKRLVTSSVLDEHLRPGRRRHEHCGEAEPADPIRTTQPQARRASSYPAGRIVGGFRGCAWGSITVQARHGAGKTDAVDAISAARAALTGTATGTPKSRTGNIEAIRVLTIARRSAANERISVLNQIRHVTFTAFRRHRETACRSRRQPAPDPFRSRLGAPVWGRADSGTSGKVQRHRGRPQCVAAPRAAGTADPERDHRETRPNAIPEHLRSGCRRSQHVALTRQNWPRHGRRRERLNKKQRRARPERHPIRCLELAVRCSRWSWVTCPGSSSASDFTPRSFIVRRISSERIAMARSTPARPPAMSP